MVVAPPPAWHSAASMPERRSYFAAAQLGGDIYVAGGMVGASGTYVLRNERFDPRRNRWTREPDLPREARAAAGAAFEGKLFVIGGQTEQGVTRRVYAFDPRTRRWSTRAPLPAPRYNAAAAALAGRLYVAGGVRTSIRFARWSPSTRGRIAGAALRRFRTPCTPRRSSRSGAARSIGGFDRAGDAVRSVWIYSPRTKRWRSGPRLEEPAAMLGATAAGGRIYAASEREFETYVPGRGWRRGPQLAVPRHALGLFAAAGRLWAVGGCVVPELADSRVVEFRPLPS